MKCLFVYRRGNLGLVICGGNFVYIVIIVELLFVFCYFEI